MSKPKIAGWVLSGLLAAFLILGSARGKFTEWDGKTEMFEHLGYASDVMFAIGIVEVVVTVLFLVPRAAFVGGILLTAYLGGATATHVRVGDPYFVPIVIGAMIWIALGLRDRRVFELAFQVSPHTASASTE